MFQSVLKAALPFLPYRKPEIIHSVHGIPQILEKKKCDHVLIITDTGIIRHGLITRLEDTLDRHFIPYIIYDGTVANPTTTNVNEALALYHEYDCNAIIGFGGGSSIDCAKP